MRKLLVLGLILWCCLPVLAVDQVTVAQLQQRLAAAHGKSDKYLEHHIANLQLTERLDHRKLLQLSRSLPGKNSQTALLAIADASVFLYPPRSEMVMEVGPPPKTQGEILLRAAQFVAQESHRMPDFLAQRVTTRFQDAKHFPYSTVISYYTPANFHFFDRRIANLRYVDGKEEEMKPNGHTKRERDITLAPKGLTTWGEFGPLLDTVMTDVLQSKVGWDWWERTDTGRLAVFRFFVPQEKSHYTVEYCCIVSPKGATTEFKAMPAYQGELTIEPETGRVVRVVLKCDLAPKQVITRADVELEYGSVDIAGKSYFLPLRGVTASATPTMHYHSVGSDGYTEMDQYVITSINDLKFQDYRVFRTEMRILPADPADKSPQ
ncbi:MAG: hypothetical protein ACLGSD_04870 [Acidobacteriota bacterium]